MAHKTVLVLEDEIVMRATLQDGLEKRGIEAIVAATADEARNLLKDVPDIDVVVLDIRLGDGVIENGFDFGVRLKKEQGDWPPEFLIHSAYEDVDYFQAALKLGVAAYLKKGGFGNVKLTRVETVAQHVRALALRRALRSPGMAGRRQGIAATSENRDEAIERFCGEVLSEELEATFGRDYILLLTRSGGTAAFSGRPLAHVSSTALERLQSAIHARLGNTEPFVVNSAGAFSASAQEREVLLRALLPIEGAAFIELGEVNSARLSLGLVPGEQSAEAVKEQVKLIDRYLQRPVMAHLLEITEMWAEMELTRELGRRETLLRATTDFCLSQSELLASLVWEAEKEAGEAREWPSLTSLRMVADEMRDAGELLVHFGMSDNRREEPGLVAVDMAALVDRIWEQDVFARLRIRAPHVLRREGHCVARERVTRAERTVSQIMSWLARRLVRPDREPHSELAEEPLPELLVLCLPADGHDRVQIIFEEHRSPRLPREARATLFTPFSRRIPTELANDIAPGRRLGLYLAQTLAELAGGALFERSDDLEGEHGHRFVLELPAAEESA